MVDEQVLQFLIENSEDLLVGPCYGNLKSIFCVYLTGLESQNHDVSAATFKTFIDALSEIEKIAVGSINFSTQKSGFRQEPRVLLLDVSLLRLLSEKPRLSAANDMTYKHPKLAAESQETLFARLMAVLENNSSEIRSEQLLLSKLESLLSIRPAFIQLAKERARHTTKLVGYIPICDKAKHADLLATAACISNDEIVSIQGFKLSRAEVSCPGLMECLQQKKHYVPHIKSHTDISLGDCSYLDTCHKLNTCRYTHYLQYIPESLYRTVSAKAKLANKLSEEQRRYPFYTHGICSSNFVRKELPQQWIRCDVRKFDFTILGKFSAVIADPAWNIHMNLPYGTCNDNELLELRFDQLQDEGVLFLWVTGRAVEMGKEFLNKWGYEILHEVSWIKTNQLNRTIVTGRTGHWLNHSKEHLLVGLKGDPKWLNRNLDTDIIVSATRETSRKPDELYGLIERLVGPHARKLEFFGRDHNLRPGWFTIGNQLPGTCIIEQDVKKRYEQFIATTNKTR